MNKNSEVIFRLETEPLALECLMARHVMEQKLMNMASDSTHIGLRQRLSAEQALSLIESLLAVPEVLQEVIRRKSVIASQIAARHIAEAN
jgi:hypothetical protein